jgi:hypothetical protein
MRGGLEPGMGIDNSIVRAWAFDEDEPYARSAFEA